MNARAGFSQAGNQINACCYTLLKIEAEAAFGLERGTGFIGFGGRKQASSGERCRDIVKPIRLTRHAREQCAERGATEAEVIEAIRQGRRRPAKHGRELCRFNFSFGKLWQSQVYPIKQVAPVIQEKADEIVVITVYTFYF